MSTHLHQAAETILMVRPSRFGYNSETALTNIFQKNEAANLSETIHQKALFEFDELVKALRSKKIYVIVLQAHDLLDTPDAIFPNNWISFHQNRIVVYPMMAANRRQERRGPWIKLLRNEFAVREILDLSEHENEGRFLEGTGSIVFDHIRKIAYVNISTRSNLQLAIEFAKSLAYKLILFTAADETGREIYHTNVLMAIGVKTAVLCSKAIVNEGERKMVQQSLATDRHLIEISFEQMLNFAGNMLLVSNRDHQLFWVMSERAYQSLSPSQLKALRDDGEFIYTPIPTIETIGGGSARCMMCEIF